MSPKQRPRCERCKRVMAVHARHNLCASCRTIGRIRACFYSFQRAILAPLLGVERVEVLRVGSNACADVHWASDCLRRLKGSRR